jgi:cytochrome c oxidase subunit IV
MVSTRASFVLVWAVCMVLLGANVVIGTYVEVGASGVPLVIGIASVQAFLVAWFFLHLRSATSLVRLSAFATFFWLTVMFALSLADYLTRA